MLIYFLVSLCVVGGIVFMLMNMSSSSDKSKYSEVMEHFDNLEVSEFSLDLGSGELKYKLRGESKDTEKHVYNVPNVSLFANEILGSESQKRADLCRLIGMYRSFYLVVYEGIHVDFESIPYRSR